MWRGLVENYSERTLWTAGAPLHTLAFVAANVGLHLMHRHQILARYKIQPLKYPTDQLMRKGLVVRLSYFLSLSRSSCPLPRTREILFCIPFLVPFAHLGGGGRDRLLT
jgi:hypothetical protein